MTSKRETILAAITTLLETIPGTGGVFRAKQPPIVRDDNPIIVFDWSGEIPNETVIPFMDWQLSVRIEIVARGIIPDQVADPIINLVYAALMSNPTISGNAMDTFPVQVGNNPVEVDNGGTVIIMDFRIKHRTAYADMTA